MVQVFLFDYSTAMGFHGVWYSPYWLPLATPQTNKTGRVSKPPRKKPPKRSNQKVYSMEIDNSTEVSGGGHSVSVRAKTSEQPTVHSGANVEGSADGAPSESAGSMESDATSAMSARAIGTVSRGCARGKTCWTA